jgi:signal transduction histidine kinase
MPISKNLMELMGGKIFFESQVGSGITFLIEIPMERILKEGLYRHRSASKDAA